MTYPCKLSLEHNTVEPPVSGHPRDQEQVSAYHSMSKKFLEGI